MMNLSQLDRSRRLGRPDPEFAVLSVEAALDLSPSALSRGDRWVYLGSNFSRFVALREKLQSASLTLETAGGEFHKIIESIEQEYLSFCSEIGKLSSSSVFWGTHLPSRNSFAVPLLERLVYLEWALGLKKRASGPSRVVLIAESPALRMIVHEALGDRRLRLKMSFRLKSWLMTRLSIAKGIAKCALFVVRSLKSKWALRHTQPRDLRRAFGGGHHVALRTWLTEGAEVQKGKSVDRNFGPLREFLEKNGKTVWHLPMFFNLKGPVLDFKVKLGKARKDFLQHEHFLGLLDYLGIALLNCREVFRKFRGFEWRELDVSALLRECHLATSVYPELIELNCNDFLFRRLRKLGLKLEKVFYPAEGNCIEKSFILAARKHFGEAKIIGFQHSVWFREQLCMYLTQSEWNRHPLPDLMICSGSRYPEIMQGCGYPKGLLVLGSNLRFTDNNRSRILERTTAEAGKPFVITVVLNGFPLGSMELLDRICGPLSRLKQCEIVLKSHPLLDVEMLAAFLKRIGFPSFRWSDRGVHSLLEGTDLVLMSYGSVSNLEVMITGRPIIRVSSSLSFDLDPLWDKYPIQFPTATPEELENSILKAVAMTKEEAESLKLFGEEIRKGYFEPIHEEGLKVFLNGK